VIYVTPDRAEQNMTRVDHVAVNMPAATGNLITAGFPPAGGGYIVIREG